MDNYFEILEVVKKKITESQYRVMTAANIERNILFWNIGQVIVAHSKWGNKFVETLIKFCTRSVQNVIMEKYQDTCSARRAVLCAILTMST